MFDIVIPLGPNENGRIHDQILQTKKHVQGYRNIYLISYDKHIQVDGCITIDESIFPFLPFISDYFAQYQGKKNRNGWYFQQLLKLYAAEYIPDLLDHYLVIDADVFFLRDVEFLTADGVTLFSHGDENHTPYFDHMKRVHPALTKYNTSEPQKSGICHHMLFHRPSLQEMFRMVESHHNTGEPFWKIFITCVLEHTFHDPVKAAESGASEYEMYFNYMLHFHPDKVRIRYLPWSNVSGKNFSAQRYLHSPYYYISACHWM